MRPVRPENTNPTAQSPADAKRDTTVDAANPAAPLPYAADYRGAVVDIYA